MPRGWLWWTLQSVCVCERERRGVVGGVHKEHFVRLCHHLVKTSVLNIQSRRVKSSSTQQAPPKSPRPSPRMAKWPRVTTLCVPSPFFLSHTAGNNHRNGSPLPSERTQICVPVRFKHLLRPHLAESVLRWDVMEGERERKEKGELLSSLFLPEPLGSGPLL